MKGLHLVKELVDNSIDKAETKSYQSCKWGIDLIEVSDNGVEYQKKALLIRQPTTSKISSLEDLNNFNNGFRGSTHQLSRF